MKWGWLLAAVALAAFLLARRRKLGRLELGFGALVTLGAVLVGTGVVDLPNIEKLIEDVGTRLGRWTYLLVGVLAFLETGAFVGLVAPGETAVLVGGLVAGQGQIEISTSRSILPWPATRPPTSTAVSPGATSPTNAPVSRNASTPTSR